MTTATPTPTPAPGNETLADALITVAGMLRLHPALPEIYALDLTPNGHDRQGWKIQMTPTVVGESEEIDAVRTFAAILGPQAETRLSDPRGYRGKETFRHLSAEVRRGLNRISLWVHIAHTPTPTVSES